MTAAPVTATCTAVFPLSGGPDVICDRMPHTTRLHTAEHGGVPFAWSDPDSDPLPAWEQATLDAVRAVYGNDLPRTRADRIVVVGCAMLTLSSHQWRVTDEATFECTCGWTGDDHERHVAEQLYATGALDRQAPPVVELVAAAGELVDRLRGRASTPEMRRVVTAVDNLRGTP